MNYFPLVDYQLREFIANGHIEFTADRFVNPASINLRIGLKGKIEVQKPDGNGSEMKELDLHHYSKESPFWVSPGQLVLTEPGTAVP